MNLHELSLSIFLPVFARALGALALINLGDSQFSFFKNILLSALASIFILSNPHFSVDPRLSHYGLLPLNFLLGVFISLPFVVFLELASGMGEMIENGRGQNIAEIYNQQSGEQSKVLALLLNKYAFAALLSLGIFEQILDCLRGSFIILDFAEINSLDLKESSLQVLNLVSTQVMNLFSFYLVFAILYLMIDFFVVIASKCAGGLSLVNESFEIKTYVTFLTFLVLLQTDFSHIMLEAARPRMFYQ